MQVLNERADLDAFFAELKTASTRVLMLDYDGTLSPFVAERHQAIPYPGVRERLIKLADNDHTRTIIITGREIKELKPLLGLDFFPEIWGCHGAERLSPAYGYQVQELSPEQSRGLREIRSWADSLDLTSLYEKKPTALAFHWRGLPERRQQELEHIIRTQWDGVVTDKGLDLHAFDGGIEIRITKVTKGGAVAAILSEIGPDASVAYLGDDYTDEDAFIALDGHGLRVLVRTEERATRADIWIHPPRELLSFLDRWIASCQ